MQRPNSVLEQIFKRGARIATWMQHADGDDDACFKGIFEALSALLKIGILRSSLLLLAAAKVKLQAPYPQLWRRARIRRVCRTLEAVKSLLQRGGSATLDSYASTTTTWM